MSTQIRTLALLLLLAVAAATALAATNAPDAEPAKPPKPAATQPTQPARQTPKPTPPAVKNGLAISVTLAKRVYPRTEPIAMTVTLKNVSAKPIVLAGMTMFAWRPSGGIAFRLKDRKTAKTTVLREGMNPMIAAPVRMENKTLAPGSSLTVRARIGRWARRWPPPPLEDPKKKRPRARGQFLGPDLLPAGTYELSVRCEFGEGFGKQKATWIGEIESKPVGFRVVEKPAAERPQQPDEGKGPGGEGEWIELFADRRWYKNQAGKERVFTGVLQSVPGAGGPSTLMRAAYYRLGRYRIYTGARKHPALDKLVGKPVQIRGKAVEMNLEGRHLSEIWPAAVRRIRPAVPRPMTPRPLAPAKGG